MTSVRKFLNLDLNFRFLRFVYRLTQTFSNGFAFAIIAYFIQICFTAVFLFCFVDFIAKHLNENETLPHY